MSLPIVIAVLVIIVNVLMVGLVLLRPGGGKEFSWNDVVTVDQRRSFCPWIVMFNLGCALLIFTFGDVFHSSRAAIVVIVLTCRSSLLRLYVFWSCDSRFRHLDHTDPPS